MQQDTNFSEGDLDRLLAASEFVRSERLSRFLRFLYHHSRTSTERLKETEIGTAVFDRAVGYDPKLDSIVRVEATRLRKKLAAHYAGEGASDPIRIRLPQGRYELEFVPAEPAPDPMPAPEQSTATQPTPVAARHTSRLRIYLPILASAVLLAVLAVTLLPRPSTLVVTSSLTALKGSEQLPAISPDSSWVAFAWDGEETSSGDHIYLTRPGSGHPTLLTDGGTASESCPAWSADSRELAYFRRIRKDWLELRIRRIADASEESLAELHSSSPCPGLSFSPDGHWIAAAEQSASANIHHLVLIRRATHEKRFFRPVSGSPASRSNPVFSPDGKQIAFVDSPESSSADIYIADFPERTERRVTFDNRPIRGLAWLPSQRALIAGSYREKGSCSLWRIPLDGAPPTRLTEPGNTGWHPSVSSAGRLVFTRYMFSTRIWRGVPGEVWISSVGLNSSPRFSPDGQKLAFRSNRSGSSEIWLLDSPSGTPRPLTAFDGPVTGSPRWSPDGATIVFDSRTGGKADIFTIPVTGGNPRRFTDAASNEVTPVYSPDGRFIYYASDREGAWALWRKPTAGGTEELIRRQAFAPQFSPDGRFLYYTRGPNQEGLFRSATLPGAEEEPVLPKLPGGLWGNWAPTTQGLFFIDRTKLHRLDTDGRTQILAEVEAPIWWDGGLDATRDGARIAYSTVGRNDSDLYWVASVR